MNSDFLLTLKQILQGSPKSADYPFTGKCEIASGRAHFRSFFGKYAYQNDRNGISQKICIHSASVLLQCIQMPDWRNHKS